MAKATLPSTHLPTAWVRDQITFLRQLAQSSGASSISAGLDSAALMLEAELSTYRSQPDVCWFDGPPLVLDAAMRHLHPSTP